MWLSLSTESLSEVLLLSKANKIFLIVRPVYQITWPALVSSSPSKKAIIINILFSRSFESINRWKKNWVRNKQYGPITQLIRCVYWTNKIMTCDKQTVYSMSVYHFLGDILLPSICSQHYTYYMLLLRAFYGHWFSRH